MEVLDNGSHIKDSENKTSGGNYSCRQSRDMTIGSTPNAHNRGEANIQLLLACKAQLSSEVIRLKTESLCLHKEREATRVRMKELDQMLAKLTDRTRELENRLHVSEDENKRLRVKLLGLSNTSALQKLSMSLDKFHSYPWSENRSNPPVSPLASSASNTLEVKKGPAAPPQQDWRDVSRRLLEQMRQEMKEFKEMSSSFSMQESNSDSAVEIAQKISVGDDDDVEESLSSLQTEMESLKLALVKQNRMLKSFMNDGMQGNVYLPAGDLSNSESKAFKTLEPNADKSSKAKSFTCQLSRHSDDSFRAFFTKQLEDGQNIDKMGKNMLLFLNSNAPDLSKPPPKAANSKAMKYLADGDKKTFVKKPAEEGRMCPICQVPFDESIPQKEFEEHVVDHLEVESASLLDQYVVL